MELIIDDRVRKFIRELQPQDRLRVGRYIDHFEEFGFHLPAKYLKKVTDSVWELRPGRIRVFIYQGGDKVIAVHAVAKAAQKIKKHDLDLIHSRILEWKIR